MLVPLAGDEGHHFGERLASGAWHEGVLIVPTAITPASPAALGVVREGLKHTGPGEWAPACAAAGGGQPGWDLAAAVADTCPGPRIQRVPATARAATHAEARGWFGVEAVGAAQAQAFVKYGGLAARAHERPAEAVRLVVGLGWVHPGEAAGGLAGAVDDGEPARAAAKRVAHAVA